MNTPHSNDPRDNLEDFVLGKDGQPLVDRYGRPIRKRRPQQEQQRPAARQKQPTIRPERREPQETRQYQPREYEPREYRPRQYPPQQRPVQHRPQQQRPEREPVPMQVTQRPQRPQRQRPQRSLRRRRRRKGGCGRLLAALLVMLLALTFLVDARLSRVDALPAERIANTSGTNWLLVGSDSRTGLSEEEAARLGTGGDLGTTRTDTIMLLHLPLFGKATLVSIPRDSYVAVPGYGQEKINAAFAYGGPQLLVQTVEQATGLRVDRYAEIGMGGLANIVDAVGGVEICVSESIQDPLANLFVEPGCQKMDGATALGYVRTRATAQGDLDRVGRQREFLGALTSRILSPGVLLNPFRALPLLWTAPAMFTVGSKDHVWNLARIGLAFSMGLNTETIPVGGFMDADVGNVILWDEVAAEQLFSSLR
ncbi:LCP family protein [Corynebacterium sp. NML130628]|uniref:LCP family protein n=1 Tax=Corynebacterium sp. NML130628 TaxID=1906333 RepID=UPI0008FB83D7|nr:LCP family protein [Corynebacterium sp. NML130628]